VKVDLDRILQNSSGDSSSSPIITSAGGVAPANIIMVERQSSTPNPQYASIDGSTAGGTSVTSSDHDTHISDGSSSLHSASATTTVAGVIVTGMGMDKTAHMAVPSSSADPKDTRPHPSSNPLDAHVDHSSQSIPGSNSSADGAVKGMNIGVPAITGIVDTSAADEIHAPEATTAADGLVTRPPTSTNSPGDVMNVDKSTFAGNTSAQASATATPNGSNPGATTIPLDLVDSIEGMYRILDLVNEQSSSGLGKKTLCLILRWLLTPSSVDKIIISQNSLGRFVNDVSWGAYQSMTNVNFGALDQLLIKPIGLYGSKSEIVRYLRDLDVVNDEM
jgi:hypothetical protein